MFYLQHETNSATRVSIQPEYDYKEEDKLVEVQHRTRDGSLYQYTWGSYVYKKFSLKWINSADASVINSWWKSKATLHFYEDTAPTAVETVMLLNKSKPIGKRIKPYSDKFAGTIELSTF